MRSEQLLDILETRNRSNFTFSESAPNSAEIPSLARAQDGQANAVILLRRRYLVIASAANRTMLGVEISIPVSILNYRQFAAHTLCNEAREQAMNVRQLSDNKHKFRLVLCGHKAIETSAACLILMVQGQLAQVTAGHFLIASETGILTVFPLVGITLTRHARHFTNRWITAVFVGVCAFFADAVIHRSHYPGAYTEALLTALGASTFSVLISFTPVGRKIDHLAESFQPHQSPVAAPARRVAKAAPR